MLCAVLPACTLASCVLCALQTWESEVAQCGPNSTNLPPLLTTCSALNLDQSKLCVCSLPLVVMCSSAPHTQRFRLLHARRALPPTQLLFVSLTPTASYGIAVSQTSVSQLPDLPQPSCGTVRLHSAALHAAT